MGFASSLEEHQHRLQRDPDGCNVKDLLVQEGESSEGRGKEIMKAGASSVGKIMTQ